MGCLLNLVFDSRYVEYFKKPEEELVLKFVEEILLQALLSSNLIVNRHTATSFKT